MSKAILEFKSISKSYPGVQALKEVNFDLQEGEVHALVGENGAGKSTLIKTCSGAESPSSGTITINGQDFLRLTPAESLKSGISVIYQEFNLVRELTVAENIFLGRALRNGMIIDMKAMIEKSKELFGHLEIDIDPTELVKNLSTGYQQLVEIAKAISMNSKILIMDEPSASLTDTELVALFKMIEKLKRERVSIIYISHRLDEIFKISDRVSVLRDGRLIASLTTSNTTHDELVKFMVGRELKFLFPPKEESQVFAEETMLEVDNLSGNGLSNISLTIKRGEILGIGGLVGAGRTEFAEILFGVARKSGGKILYKGEELNFRTPIEAIDKGFALVPEDRKQQGVLLHMSVENNITMPILKRISKNSVINRFKENKIIKQYVSNLQIKTPSFQQLACKLSGGNQQKVALAKWLASEPEIIIFDEPTRGIDVGAKYEIYTIINKLASIGKTLIIISSEMEELMGMSDRIVVFSEGRLTGELQREDFNQETILKLASITQNKG